MSVPGACSALEAAPECVCSVAPEGAAQLKPVSMIAMTKRLLPYWFRNHAENRCLLRFLLSPPLLVEVLPEPLAHPRVVDVGADFFIWDGLQIVFLNTTPHIEKLSPPGMYDMRLFHLQCRTPVLCSTCGVKRPADKQFVDSLCHYIKNIWDDHLAFEDACSKVIGHNIAFSRGRFSCYPRVCKSW